MTIEPGDICSSQTGDIGIVFRHSPLTGLYTGKTLDGQPWQSILPIFLAKSVREYLNLEQLQK